MSKEKHIIHSDSDCLSEKLLFDYIDNKLSQKERHIVEKHLLDCELCSDALEGLEMVKDRGRITLIKEEINKRILAGGKEETKVIAFNYKLVFSVAATVALLVVGVFLFKQMSLKEDMGGDLAELKETENSSPSLSPPPPPPPPATTEESESVVSDKLEQTGEANGVKSEGGTYGPGKGVFDQEVPAAEQQKPDVYFKKGEGAAAESKNEVAVDEIANPAFGTTIAENDAAASDDRKSVNTESAPAAPKSSAAEPRKDGNLADAKKLEEKTVTGIYKNTPDQNNKQQTTGTTTATTGNSANNNTTTKTPQNLELAKESDKAKNKDGVYRSENKPAEQSEKKAKKNAGKESSKADEDLAIAGTVGYEPESIVKEREKLKEAEEVVTLSTTSPIVMTDSTSVAKNILVNPEKMPVYASGEIEMNKFIRTNFNYDKDQFKSSPPASNKIYVTFTVAEDGTIKDAKILKGINPTLDAEALRVIRLMPKWKPGELNGKPTAMQMNLPIKLEFK